MLATLLQQKISQRLITTDAIQKEIGRDRIELYKAKAIGTVIKSKRKVRFLLIFQDIFYVGLEKNILIFSRFTDTSSSSCHNFDILVDSAVIIEGTRSLIFHCCDILLSYDLSVNPYQPVAQSNYKMGEVKKYLGVNLLLQLSHDLLIVSHGDLYFLFDLAKFSEIPVKTIKRTLYSSICLTGSFGILAAYSEQNLNIYKVTRSKGFSMMKSVAFKGTIQDINFVKDTSLLLAIGKLAIVFDYNDESILSNLRINTNAGFKKVETITSQNIF